MHQIRFAPGLRPRPRWEAHNAPQTRSRMARGHPALPIYPSLMPLITEIGLSYICVLYHWLFCSYVICAYKNIHSCIIINIIKYNSFCIVIYNTNFLNLCDLLQASECTKFVLRRGSSCSAGELIWRSPRPPSRMGRGNPLPYILLPSTPSASCTQLIFFVPARLASSAGNGMCPPVQQ